MRLLRDPIVLVTGIVVVVGLVVALAWSALTPDAAPQDGPRAGSERVEDRAEDPDRPGTDINTDRSDALDDGEVVQLAQVTDLSSVIGHRVVVDRAQVQTVPVDEGFWILDAGGDRIWVQLSTPGESPFVVRPDQRVSFSGQVVEHGPDFARNAGLTEADAEALTNVGAHIVVPVGEVAVFD